jgi:hypothetical protein
MAAVVLLGARVGTKMLQLKEKKSLTLDGAETAMITL